MNRILCLLLFTFAAVMALAAGRGDFESLSDAAAKKYSLSNHVGSLYAEKFSDWSTEPMVHSMDVCGSRPASNQYCDIIAVVAADGRVRRVLLSPNNSYEACVEKTLRLGQVAPKPPADSWPVQIRLIDGLRPHYKGGDKPFIILSNGHVP